MSSEILHDRCRCSRIDRFGGEWGTPEVTALFRTYAELQFRSGLRRAWQDLTRQTIADNYSDPEDKPVADRIRQDWQAELPLGILLSGFSGNLPGQRYDPLGRRHHVLSEYGLVLVNPATGEFFSEGWVAAIDYTEGPQGRLFKTAPHDGFTPGQRRLMVAQMLAQESLGVLLLDDFLEDPRRPSGNSS